ncbi:aquacobalamin reductase / NAD(P)H-flavin reductase [Pseudidiomarina planktonica]|uniref:Aquacobalamin reductase / NAD(P)H-flavin reductase n=1 Tax=Pseudidiomarina planktonica TaxID=1323738 RepID=A0A1Y6G3A7_9GAMM|nr:NAD(P)H-flavin reductase [Pseudidiomarina planktonica]RUO63884.1 NAD(P)H-flavin reductase [Pseudidiomarina planktonica]SMQ80042.1 aquacobalamin reductase / NAD(P)H-flavin reductase [Pseudidiomarina planktonica]
MKQLQASLVTLEALTPAVYRVELELAERIQFAGGQYLQVVMGDNDKRPFSIASCPGETDLVELHIGATPDNGYAMEVIEALQQQGELLVELPLGDASYRADSERPLILIAGGTGFSYTWSILQAHLASASERPVTLYWGGRRPEDLYLDAELQELAAEHSQLSYRPVVEEAEAGWHGAIGLVHHTVMVEQPEFAKADVYVAGRFEMVRVIRDDFNARGLPLDNLYGDALAFI